MNYKGVIIEDKLENIFYKYYKSNNHNHTLLLLHGLTGTSSVWDDYIEVLKQKFNIILIDLIGHGNSGTPKRIEDYSLQFQADKINRILDKLKIESISIISYSFSSYIGLLVREKKKKEIKSMIFISPYFREKV